MELVRKILEFDVEAKKDSTHAINKRTWSSTQAQIETQLGKINASVWNGMSKEDVAKAISKVIYTLTVVACDAGIENMVKEYLRSEHRQ